MGSVPVIESLSDPRILCVVAFWTCFGILLFKSLKTPITKEQRYRHFEIIGPMNVHVRDIVELLLK